MYKFCIKCGEKKDTSSFYIDNQKSDGFCCYCKECIKSYRKKNKEKIAYQKKICRERHKDEVRNYQLKYNKDNREIIKKRRHDFRKRNRKKINEYERNRRRNNPRVRLRYNISSMMANRLRRRISNKGDKPIFSFLPYTLNDLMEHLESRFKPEMSWSNYGKWHIDHIIPDSLFNYTSINDEEFQRCWSLNNLQPLWAEENIRKSNNY